MPVLQHSICTNSILHIVSGVLLNIGKLLCTVAVICAVVAAANPVGIAVTVAAVISAVAAVAYLAVTGVSIRDLYKSCKQVIQVKEEGLVTVQSLQPVLTPITPIAGKIGCDEIGDAVGANAEDVASIAAAGVKVAKDTAKVGAKIAKGGLVTGAIGGLVLGAAAGNVAQTTSLAAAQTAAEVAKTAAATAAQYAQAAQASVGGGLAGLIVKAGGADWVASVTGALGPQGAEILGLLTGAAGLAAGAVALVLGGALVGGGLLVAGVIAKPPYPKT